MALDQTVAANADAARYYAQDQRYKALRLLWRRSTLTKSVRTCQHHSIMPDGVVKAVVTPTPNGPRAGFQGLATCGSVWACPVCSHKVATRRSEQLAEAIRRWESQGGRVAMVTLTMRHKRGQDLSDLWDALSYAWQAVLKNEWAADQETYGTPIPRLVTHGKRKGQVVTENRIGWVRAVEATHGVNGWHLHIHALLFLKGDPDLDGLGKSMFQRWRDALIRKGLAAPIASRGGLDAKWIEGTAEPLAGYFTKNTYDGALRAGFEVARGQQKTGRKDGGRTPFEMLLNVTENLDNADDPLAQSRAVRDLARWHLWENVSKGKLQITWSRGFRDFLGLDDEQTDEDIAAEDMTTEETVVNAHYVNL